MSKYFSSWGVDGIYSRIRHWRNKCAVNLASVTNGIELIDKISFPTEAQKGYEHVKEKLLLPLGI